MVVADSRRAHRRNRVVGFPVRRRVVTSTGLLPVHSRSSLWLCLRPLRTPGHPDALGISYRTSTTKLEKDFNLLAGEAAWRTTRLRGAVAPLKAVVERIPQP